MKKRFLSIVLAVLMLVGIMPISAIAADAEPPAAQTGVSTKTSENTTGPKLENRRNGWMKKPVLQRLPSR